MSLPTSTAVADAADRLLHAARTGEACAPVRDLIGPDDLDAAYAVAQRVVAGLGRRPVGRKIGLTSPAVQAQLGVDQPDLGVLLEGMAVPHEGTLALDRLVAPRVEAEIAFVLGADLLDGPLGPDDVRGAVAHQVAALEIVDSRIADWDITVADTVADNGSSAAYVLGPTTVALADVEPVGVAMTLTRNGEEVSSGTGAACLGDPLAALSWLARTARAFGDPLRAGQVVLSGALGPMVPATAGDVFTAHLTGLGEATVTLGGRP
ncbi:2-keto-4-pentenoate hydratase [Actinomycetospora termitidis]|uniref:Fumarylacetoacetate hydrolase family protein n=1 Tax=Actinomycetospora termitidis TaxID=3053470 RepID=A0ABT7M420_9PSEU|nr:fumarylacetoacetate hydrolase family protein [Actinomycetospora sp. Odt1-22]MDL5155186.1 fumarylacetoacetate hydrolase family protein [Actinomycetospora sp. Odt1-22]